MNEFLNVDEFTFDFNQGQREILNVKGVNVFEDREIWLQNSKNGQGWDVLISYQPIHEGDTETINPTNLKRAWAQKFKTEMEKDYYGKVIPWNMGRNLSMNEVLQMVTYFRRMALVGILRKKQDSEYYGVDLGREKWSNYWAGEGYQH